MTRVSHLDFYCVSSGCGGERGSDTALILYILISVSVITVSAVSCPSGDTDGIVKSGMNCSELISSKNYECYDSTIKTLCCASCNDIAGNDPDCLYGDRQSGCFDFACPILVNVSDCCETCASTTTTSTTPSTSTSLTSTTTSSTTSTSTTTTLSTTSTSSTTSASSTPSTTTDTLTLPVTESLFATSYTSEPGTLLSHITSEVPTSTQSVTALSSPARSPSSAAPTSPSFTSMTSMNLSTDIPLSSSSYALPSKISVSIFVTSVSSKNSNQLLTTGVESELVTNNEVDAIVGGVIGGVIGVSLITTVAVVAAIKLKKCKKNKVSVTDDDTPGNLENKRPIAMTDFIAKTYLQAPNETTKNGQAYSVVDMNDTGTHGNTSPLLQNKNEILPNGPTNGHLDTRNKATDSRDLQEYLNTPDVSYVFTIDPPFLMEMNGTVEQGIQKPSVTQNQDNDADYTISLEDTPNKDLKCGFRKRGLSQDIVDKTNISESDPLRLICTKKFLYLDE